VDIATLEAHSGILGVELMNGMAIPWLPWQPQCDLVTGAGRRVRDTFQKTHLENASYFCSTVTKIE
jgi:hypothetical protein